jgi:hypothetical protein
MPDPRSAHATAATAAAAATAATAAGPASTAEVETSPPERLAQWAQQLGTTTEALQGAVQAVGPRVDRIKDWLTGGMAADQEDA